MIGLEDLDELGRHGFIYVPFCYQRACFAIKFIEFNCVKQILSPLRMLKDSDLPFGKIDSSRPSKFLSIGWRKFVMVGLSGVAPSASTIVPLNLP